MYGAKSMVLPRTIYVMWNVPSLQGWLGVVQGAYPVERGTAVKVNNSPPHLVHSHFIGMFIFAVISDGMATLGTYMFPNEHYSIRCVCLFTS